MVGVTGWWTGFGSCVRVSPKTGTAAIIPLYKGKGERTECSNYRGNNLLSMIGKINAGILVDSP